MRPVDGVPELTHLKILAERGDQLAIARLEALPQLSPHAAHVWDWFGRLNELRQSNGFGPARITRAEIHAFEADECLSIQPWERDALIRLDALYIAERARQSEKAKT